MAMEKCRSRRAESHTAVRRMAARVIRDPAAHLSIHIFGDASTITVIFELLSVGADFLKCRNSEKMQLTLHKNNRNIDYENICDR